MRQCEWYAGCQNEVAGVVAHPILGDVPTCERCANKHDMTLRAFARHFGSQAEIIDFAAQYSITLEPGDIGGSAEAGFTIDSMDADEWIEAMTSD